MSFTLLAMASSFGYSVVLFDQMTNPGAGTIASGFLFPDGSDADTHSYDNFLLAQNSAVTDVSWIGTDFPGLGFTIRFYQGLPASPDYQPLITALPDHEGPADYIKGFEVTDNAGKTPYGPQGSGLFAYHYVLPTSLRLTGNTVYWIKIEGLGNSYWGISTASHGRDSRHITYFTGGPYFLAGPGSEAFQLSGSLVPEPASMIVSVLAVCTLLRRRILPSM